MNFRIRCPRIEKKARSAAFSLTEVVLALGIVTVAMVPMVGMMPLGIQIQKNTVDESAGINILSTVVADRRAAVSGTTSPIYNMPALPVFSGTTTSGSFAVSDAGAPVPASDVTARYRIQYDFFPPQSSSGSNLLHFRATWPAMPANTTDSVELVTTISNSTN